MQNKYKSYYQIYDMNINYGYSLYLYPILNKILINLSADELNEEYMLVFNGSYYSTLLDNVELEYYIEF